MELNIVFKETIFRESKVCNIYLYKSEIMYKTAFFHSFDEGVSGAIICDGQSQSVFMLCNFDFFRLAFAMHKYEIIEADLTSKEFRHIHLVSVQSTEENLEKDKGIIIQQNSPHLLSHSHFFGSAFDLILSNH